MLIPEDVRFQAENMFAVIPEPPRELPAKLIRNARYCLFMTPIPALNFVDRIRVSNRDVPGLVEEVRGLLRSAGRSQAAWSIAAGATPATLERRLLDLGMEPYRDPPLEPESAAMAIVTPPLGTVPETIEAREVQNPDEVDRVVEVEQSAFGIPDEVAATMRAAGQALFALRRQGLDVATFYLAFRGQVPVGAARAMFLRDGVNLSGGAVLPAERGHGVYRALVAARWRDAVARGTPALTVQAGSMSKPILHRLGFTTLSTITNLQDRFTEN